MSRHFTAFLIALAGFAPSDAFGWSQKGRFGARVHGHAFDEVRLESEGCSLKVELYFTAPDAAYTEKASVRNHYQFDAKIALSGGKRFRTGTFRNDKAGRRRFRHVHDTSGEGCWAQQEHKLVSVDVNGCRNRGCKVPGF